MTKYTPFGLPKFSINVLSSGLTICLVCLGIRIATAPDLALEVANSKFVTNSSADRLKELAQKLEQQAQLLDKKDKAYQELEQVYGSTLTRQRGFGRVKQKLKAIEALPEPENLNDIQSEISMTEEILEEVSTE